MKPATPEEVEQIVSARLADLEQRIAPEALTVRDVAARLRIGVTTVRELIASGALPSYKIGTARRVDPRDLAAFIDERRQTTGRVRTIPARPRTSSMTWLDDVWAQAYDRA